MRKSLLSIYIRIASLSLVIKPCLFLALLMRTIAEVVFKGSDLLEILVVSN